MSDCLVYLAKHTHYSSWTKIGSCENWVDRSQTYKTGCPLRNIGPYYIILTKNHTLLETILLKEYSQHSSTHHTDYINGGIEWITKTLTLEEIQHLLKTHVLEDTCTILHGDALTEYLDDAERKLRDREKLMQDERDNEYTQHMNQLAILNKPIFPFNLRGYQVDAFEKIEHHYKNNDRCIINWACGLGKTIMAMCVMKQYKKVLIGVPSVLLLRQWIKCIQTYFPDFPILAITSTTVSVKNTTCSDYVNKWVSNKISYIVVSTYHSSHTVGHLKFDFKILDECHHLCQVQNDSKFCKILQIESEKQLALTATLKSVDGENKVDNFDDRAFGEIIDSKSTLWAIDNKYITDYEVVTVRVEETTLCNVMVKVLGCIDHQELFLAAFAMLESMVWYPDLTHILAYTNRIESAHMLNNYIDILLEKRFSMLSTNFYRKALDSESMKNTNLHDELDDFENSHRGIISSVYIFGEGFDISKVNGVCVAENMNSEIRIVQSVMRGNRLDSQNTTKINRIILPYIENEHDTFEKVETVVFKMGNQDANIEQRIRSCIIGTGGVSTCEQRYIVNFNNAKELDHVKLKLRHRTSIRLPGVSQTKSEYDVLRSLNSLHDVESKAGYFINHGISHARLDNPPQYFDSKDPTVWVSWYDFLGINLDTFPQTKDKWRKKCIEYNITSSNYSQKWGQAHLPEYPEDMYTDFKNICTELHEKKPRRVRHQ
jgi:superfamily II DNA or RNA helicase